MANADSLGYALGLNVKPDSYDTSLTREILRNEIEKEEAERQRKAEAEKKRAALDDKWANVDVDFSKYYGPIATEVRDEAQRTLDDIYQMRDKDPYGYGTSPEYKKRIQEFKIFTGSRELESNLIKNETEKVSLKKDSYVIDEDFDKILQGSDPDAYREALKERGRTHFTPGTYASPKGIDIEVEKAKLAPVYDEVTMPTKEGGSYMDKIFNKESNRRKADNAASDVSNVLATAIRARLISKNPIATDDEIIKMTADELYRAYEDNFKGKTISKEGKKDGGGLEINIGGGYSNDGYIYTPTKELSKDAATLKALMTVAGKDIDINDKTQVVALTTGKDKIMQVAEVPINGVPLQFRPSRYVWALDRRDGNAKWFVEGTQLEQVNARGDIKNKKANVLLPYDDVKDYLPYLDSPDKVLSNYESLYSKPEKQQKSSGVPEKQEAAKPENTVPEKTSKPKIATSTKGLPD